MLQAYIPPLSMVSPHKYLGRVIMEADDDWEAAISNMREAWKRWE